MPLLTDAMTYEELLTYPNDGVRREIHDGRLVVAASPHWRHQLVINRFAFDLELHVRTFATGGIVLTFPLDVRLTPHNVYQPDIVYISPARRPILRDTMPVEGAPDIVVEVLSPSTRDFDQREKAEIYARAGILEFWVIDPAFLIVEVFVLDGDAYTPIAQETGRAASRVLPGFFVELTALFAGL
jgi:Uma2 family endonuclease